MYQITATYEIYSATVSQRSTMAQACDEIAYLYGYYKPMHDNIKVTITHLCDNCSQGKVKKCKAPKRHSNGYHADTCYVPCKACRGNYETPVEA